MTLHATRLPVQLGAALATGVVLVLGVWIAGGLITNDYKTSMALTIAWGVVLGAACVWVAVRNRTLRVPVLAGYVLTGALVVGVLGYLTLHDKVVHEHIVRGVPASAARAAPDRNVQLASGPFASIEHGTSGTAAIVRLPGGVRRLTLARFSTSPGPDLRVRLVPGSSSDGGADGALDLGALKGNKGDQQYDVPPGADLARYRAVVIWCRAFSAAFGEAALTAS
jgi:hypothetical protein